jgi:hypothetical protein
VAFGVGTMDVRVQPGHVSAAHLLGPGSAYARSQQRQAGGAPLDSPRQEDHQVESAARLTWSELWDARSATAVSVFAA